MVYVRISLLNTIQRQSYKLSKLEKWKGYISSFLSDRVTIVEVNKISFIHRTCPFIHKRWNNIANHYHTLQVRLYNKTTDETHITG